MQRRDFIKALPVLALSTQLISEATLKKNHLIVLGSTATSIIEKYGSDLNVNSLIFVSDEEPQELAAAYMFNTYHPPVSAFTMYREHRILKGEPLPEINLSETLISYLPKLKGKLVIFAALGNFTGTTHYQAMAKFCHENRIPAHFICSLPFEFEGTKRKKHAIRSSKYVAEHFSQQVFTLDQIRHLYGNLSIRSAFAKADLCLMDIVKRRLG